MKLIKTLFCCMFIIASLFFTSCSKTTNTGGISYVSPTLAYDTLINLPSQIQTKETAGNYNLAYLIDAATIVNTLSSSLISAFVYDQGYTEGWQSTKNSNGSVSYIWTASPYAVKLTYFSSSSDSWWKYEEDSASQFYTFYYLDDKGTSGEIDWYSNSGSFLNSPYLAVKDIWTKSGSTFNSTFNFYATDGTTITSQYVSTSSTDKSGTLKIYGQNNNTGPLVQQWSFVWDSNGSGTYTNYNSDGTTVYATGSF